jgi:hypothetical protein
MFSTRCVLDFLHAKGRLQMLVVLAMLPPGVLCAQERVIIEHHTTTPEGDVVRAKADAALLLKQAELVGEKAQAQRLANMLSECDVAYKKMVTRNKTKGTLETKYQRTFDVIRFNQQLADVREELEQKAVMHRTRVGDPTGDMNSLLEKFARQSIQADHISAMKTELTAEQLDALFLTDGSNVFSGKTGKTKLEAFKWPFFIQRKEFEEDRNAFEAVCNQAVKETDAGGSLSPETVLDLLKKVAAIEEKLDAVPLSEYASVRTMETKWRKEAKAFLRDLNQTLGNCSKLDSEKLSKYAFQGKTLGELIDHLNSKGLRFSQPGQQDANLYASIFFLMRYAYQEFGKDPEGTASNASNSQKPTPASSGRDVSEKAIGMSKPLSKVYTTFQEILDVAPTGVIPSDGHWSELKAESFNKALVAEVHGTRARFTLKVEEVPHWDGWLIYTHVDLPQGFPVRVFAHFDDKDKDQLAPINKGDVVIVEGALNKSTRVENLWNSWGLSVNLSDCDVKLPSAFKRTLLIGGGGGGKFEDNRAKVPLIGFNVTTRPVGRNLVVASVQPIYMTDHGNLASKVYGNPVGKVVSLQAKPGYAVGAIVAKGGDRLDGFKVVFMRVHGGRLALRQCYESEWVGGRGGGAETRIGGDGKLVVGIFGGCGAEVDALGLVQIE